MCIKLNTKHCNELGCKYDSVSIIKEIVFSGNNINGIPIFFKKNITYQFPRRVIFADGYTFLRAAGTLPEKAGRTVQNVKRKYIKTLHVY